ncbi:MAG: T9SS type A sorting domain-containing protein [Ferruginibacter sp.]
MRDAAGVTATATARVLQPAAALRATSTAGTVTFTGGTTTVVVTATGGTAPYSGTGSFSNVRVGTYNYTVTDARGCRSVTTVNVTQSSQTTFTAAATAPDINCFGGNTTVTVTGGGGTAPYTGTGSYGVNAGRGSLRISVANPEEDAVTLIYGSIGAISSSRSYVLRFSTLGTGPNGSLQAALRQTSSPWAIVGFQQSSTYGTSRVDHEFVFNAPGTTDNASFLIEILQTSGVTYIDNIAFFESTSAGVPVSANLFDGDFENDLSNIEVWSVNDNHSAALDLTSKINNTYYYPVRDATGKIAVATAEVTQPASQLRATSTAGSIPFTGGTTTVVVSATGGTAPYTGTGNFANVRAGTYTYTVTDAAGCVSVTTITINQSGSSSLIAAANAPNINCFGGSTTVNVTASGGRAPYAGTGSYTVSTGRGSARVSVANPVPFTYTYLYAPIGPVSSSKNYVLRFSTDGTTSNGIVMAALRRSDPAWSNLVETQTASFGTSRVDHQFFFRTPENTANGSFLIKILQTAGVTYIDNIAVFEAASDGDLISEDLYGSGHFENGLDGIYTWSQTGNHTVAHDLTSRINNIYYYPVSDADGSVITVPAVTNQPAAALQATSTAGNITSQGGTTIVTVSATGGTPPYSGTGNFANVRAGTYNYTVTDARGCTSTTRITVTNNVATRAITSITTPAVTKGATTAGVLSDRTMSDSLLIERNELQINTYPNPSSNSFALMVQGGSAESVYISVSTADGRVIYTNKGNTNTKYVFGNNFVPGMYILKVSQGSVSRMSRLIKGSL